VPTSFVDSFTLLLHYPPLLLNSSREAHSLAKLASPTTSSFAYTKIELKMGMSHSTARWVAPLSFAIDFAAQQYGMLSSPNMADVHNAHLSFFSPQPYFIAGFFFPQQLFQLAWLYRLYRLDGNKSLNEQTEIQAMVDFVPYYAAGNVCIASKYSHHCSVR
jgi:hypothetical protein